MCALAVPPFLGTSFEEDKSQACDPGIALLSCTSVRMAKNTKRKSSADENAGNCK